MCSHNQAPIARAPETLPQVCSGPTYEITFPI
jgi:hypothetical protein